MLDRASTDQPTKKSETLTRRILALISVVIFLGLPIYGVSEGSD